MLDGGAEEGGQRAAGARRRAGSSSRVRGGAAGGRRRRTAKARGANLVLALLQQSGSWWRAQQRRSSCCRGALEQPAPLRPPLLLLALRALDAALDLAETDPQKQELEETRRRWKLTLLDPRVAPYVFDVEEFARRNSFICPELKQTRLVCDLCLGEPELHGSLQVMRAEAKFLLSKLSLVPLFAQQIPQELWIGSVQRGQVVFASSFQKESIGNGCVQLLCEGAAR